MVFPAGGEVAEVREEWASGKEAKEGPRSSILARRRLLFWTLPVPERITSSLQGLGLGLLSLRYYGTTKLSGSPQRVSCSGSLKPRGVVDRFYHLDMSSGWAVGPAFPSLASSRV